MKIVEINSVPYGSTGTIANGIAKVANNYGNDTYFCFSWTKYRKKITKENEMMIGGFFSKLIHIILARFTGLECMFSFFSTQRFIKKLKQINPDVIHIHNLHCWYINVPLLFKYLKKSRVKVVWTLHDCWSITGHCPHFEIEQCFKWKKQCKKCKRYKEYPNCIFDNSKMMYKIKKKNFTSLDSATIITPSNWLANYIKQSYLNKYNVCVINNGIDLNIFKKVQSDFKKIHKIENKFMLLGVAYEWNYKKGIDIIIRLAKDLSDDYAIVLVGTDDKVDKDLPKNIISIHRTNCKEDLVKIYSAADLFINPTREDTFPTVNIESLACGTPVITFKTGGSPEMLNNKCGVVIEKNNYYSFKNNIENIKSNNPFNQNNCIKQSKKYDMNDKFKEYVDLFNNL